MGSEELVELKNGGEEQGKNAHKLSPELRKGLNNVLFDEIIDAGDWYDFSENGTIDTADKMAATVNRVRTR